MARFWHALLLLLCLCITAFTQQQPWPQETGSTALSRMLDQSPLPTKAPSVHDLLMKRDTYGYASGSVCGYVTSDARKYRTCRKLLRLELTCSMIRRRFGVRRRLFLYFHPELLAVLQ